MRAGILTLCWLALGTGDLPPDVYTMRDRHLQIPIRINDARRGDLIELVLYVSTDQGRTWVGAGKAKPTQDAFNYHAEKDGLYWFSVQAVDKDGKYDPPDIAQVAPALKVMIDTQRALMQILGAERIGDEVVVSWQTLDTQADMNTLKLEYRPADQANGPWQFVPVAPALAGQARFKPATNAALAIRLTMADQAGVPAVVVKEIAAGPPVVQQSHSITPPTMPVSAPPMTAGTPSPTGIGAVPPPTMDSPAPVAPQTVTTVPQPNLTPPAPTPTTITSVPDSGGGLAPLAGVRPGEEAAAPKPATPAPNLGSNSPMPPQNSLPDIQYVRDSQVGLDFEIEKKGPSGIKKIETYITRDDGKTWYKYSESFDPNPPLNVALPKDEGTYGFRMVVYSGVMQSEGPPKSGMLPDVRLHVDRTPPAVEWYPPVPDASLPNALTLRYTVYDANLDPNSIVLEWSMQGKSGWQAITPTNARPAQVAGLANLRECTWVLPADVPNAVYLRLTARDLAGNIGERITRDPITVDLQKPVARVKRIVTATSLTPFRP